MLESDILLDNDYLNKSPKLLAGRGAPSPLTGGSLVAAQVVAAARGGAVDIGALLIRMPPTLHLVINARVTSGSSAPVSAALTWREDI